MVTTEQTDLTPRSDNANLNARGRPRVQSENNLPSETIQSEAHLGDINEVLKNYSGFGTVDHLNQAEGVFADITEFTDYQDALTHIRLAETEFMKLPSKEREKFGHDVAKWLDAAHDHEKREGIEGATGSSGQGDNSSQPTAAEEGGSGDSGDSGTASS